tara:strand:- start:568 stop:1077 length:510 start_codon:yes stop_codon:yes gene_type:complete
MWTQCTVVFSYTDKDGEVTSRIAEPRRVFKNKQGDQMLLAWCPTSREWKTFSYDSMSDICTVGIGLELLRHKDLKVTKTEVRQQMTIKTGHPQEVVVETILNNIKVYARLEQLSYATATRVQYDRSKNREYVEDAQLRLIGIERGIYEAIDHAFETGVDLGKANGDKNF